MVAQMLSQETKTQIHPNYLSQILEKLSLFFFFSKITWQDAHTKQLSKRSIYMGEQRKSTRV